MSSVTRGAGTSSRRSSRRPFGQALGEDLVRWLAAEVTLDEEEVPKGAEGKVRLVGMVVRTTHPGTEHIGFMT